MTNGKAFDGAAGSGGADGPKKPRATAVALAWIAAHVLGRTPARDRA